MSQQQFVELFMQIIGPQKYGEVFQILRSKEVSVFWNLLNKKLRIDCFNAFNDERKMRFFISTDYL